MHNDALHEDLSLKRGLHNGTDSLVTPLLDIIRLPCADQTISPLSICLLVDSSITVRFEATVSVYSSSSFYKAFRLPNCL